MKWASIRDVGTSPALRSTGIRQDEAPEYSEMVKAFLLPVAMQGIGNVIH
jgi:hypothetical protein